MRSNLSLSKYRLGFGCSDSKMPGKVEIEESRSAGFIETCYQRPWPVVEQAVPGKPRLRRQYFILLD